MLHRSLSRSLRRPGHRTTGSVLTLSWLSNGAPEMTRTFSLDVLRRGVRARGGRGKPFFCLAV